MSAFGAPALAQTHCNSMDPLELWCANLMVGTTTLSGVTFYGYFDSAVGSLSETPFTYKATPYTIDQFFIGSTNLQLK